MKSIAVSSDIRKDGVLGQGLLSGASDPLASASAGTFDFDEPARLAAEKSKASARRARCQLIWAMVFCVMFMIAEVVGGYLAKSLAIMTVSSIDAVGAFACAARCCRPAFIEGSITYQ